MYSVLHCIIYIYIYTYEHVYIVLYFLSELVWEDSTCATCKTSYKICPIVTRQWINNAKSVQAVKKCTSSAKNQAIKILQVNHVIQTNQSKLKTHTWVKSNEINHINETNQPMGQLVDQSTHPSNKSIKRKSTTQSTTIH